jgi:hypothetical protein
MEWNVKTIKKYFEAKFKALDKAVTKAEIATEKRFESVNEFRNTLSDQSRTLMPRAESESKYNGLNDRVTNLETKFEKLEGTKVGGSQNMLYIIAIVSVIISIISFGLMIYNKN